MFVRAACATAALALPAQAFTLLWDEASSGDLSDTYTAPSVVEVQRGQNRLIGSLTGGGGDWDLVTINVPTGLAIDAVRVIAFTGGGNGSFMGVQRGSQLSQSPGQYLFQLFGNDPINYVLFGMADAAETRDVLPQLVVGPPINDTPRLEAGSYAFWLNETGPFSTWTIEFNAVPEPSSALLLALAGAGAFQRRR